MPPPAQPAPVSGPGALSRRTDGGPAQQLRNLPDAKYGEQAAYQDAQRGAPLAQAPGPNTPAIPQQSINPHADAVVPFGAATQRPNEPVTTGASMGPGAGPEALGIQSAQIDQQDVQGLAGALPLLDFVANMPTSSAGARMYVNLMRANMAGGQ